MSKTAVALLALAVLISAGQWLWTRVAAHVDLQLMPGHSRRHVQWLTHNSTHIQLASAGLAAAAVAVQAAFAIG